MESAVGYIGVAAAGTIPVAEAASTPTTTITVADSAVTISSGTYLVNYYGSGTMESAATPLVLQLTSGGTTYSTASSSEGTTTQNASGSAIVTVTADTALTLVNGSTGSMTLGEAGMTVVKLA